MDVQLAMMKVLQDNQQLFDENKELKRQAADLTEKLTFQASLTFRSPLYYATNDSTAYCPRCWEAERKAVHLIRRDPTKYDGIQYWDCLSCRNTYESK
jgi:transposase-like protein